MIGSAPPFPAFEEWQKMSEDEQDALIDKMEAARRHKSRMLFGLTCAIMSAAIGVAFYIALR